jgi:hypothetical protein
MSCVKAQGFLETNDVPVAQQTDAKKEKKGRDDALALARAARRVVIGKGKKVTVFDMKKSPPDDDTLASLMLGPTGNLKAPTLRLGDTLLVGFSEDAYKEWLAG